MKISARTSEANSAPRSLRGLLSHLRQTLATITMQRSSLRMSSNIWIRIIKTQWIRSIFNPVWITHQTKNGRSSTRGAHQVQIRIQNMSQTWSWGWIRSCKTASRTLRTLTAPGRDPWMAIWNKLRQLNKPNSRTRGSRRQRSWPRKALGSTSTHSWKMRRPWLWTQAQPNFTNPWTWKSNNRATYSWGPTTTAIWQVQQFHHWTS